MYNIKHFLAYLFSEYLIPILPMLLFQILWLLFDVEHPLEHPLAILSGMCCGWIEAGVMGGGGGAYGIYGGVNIW